MPSGSQIRNFVFLALMVVIGVSCAANVVQGQAPSSIVFPKSQEEASTKNEPRPLKEWQLAVKNRLEKLQERIKELETREVGKPPAVLKRQEELLERIELILSQLASTEESIDKVKNDLKNAQADLDEFHQDGISTDEKADSFLQLDTARDALQSEMRRLKRYANKETSAIDSLEKAETDFKERSSDWRLAIENLKADSDDSSRQQLAVADLYAELAQATTRLRLQEVLLAKQSTMQRELKVELLKVRVARLNANPQFNQSELEELTDSLYRQEDELRGKIEDLEGADIRLKYLEDKWVQAQNKLDEPDGENPGLRAEVEAHQLARREIQDELPLLRKQLERLATQREIWQRRQQLFHREPARKALREWIDEASDSQAQFKREQGSQQSELEELRNLLGTLEANQKKVPATSPEAYWIAQQSESVQGLLEQHQQNLTSIRTTLSLQQKLADELVSDSLAANAKNQLLDLWNGAVSIWNYELTSFGVHSVTVQKIVSALLVFLAGMIFSRALSRALGRQVLQRLDMDPSASATIQSLFYYLLLAIFVMVAMNVAKVPLTAFTVLGGAVALGVGFGSQNIINNFISGLILLAERPVKVGDLIRINELHGNVEHIGARSTRVRTGSNLEIIVPNSSFLQNNVINFTLSSNKVRTSVDVGVVYGSPTVTVTQLLRRAVVETGRAAKDPPPIILFKSFADSSLLFEVHFWILMRTMMDQLQVESTVRYRIDQLFREEGIVIAFPQRDLHLDTASPLTIQMVENSVDSPPV